MVSMLGCSFWDGEEECSQSWYSNADLFCRKKQQDDLRLSGLNTLTFSVWISRGAGLVLSVDAAMILLPMCRNILRFIRPKVKFLPLDESQWFHRQVAYSLLFWTIPHVCAHYVK
jgi:NADPH oxidase